MSAIAKELLQGSTSFAAVRVRRAIEQVRIDEPTNATLLPLVDALLAEEPSTSERQLIKIISPHSETGLLLPDEGRYFLRSPPYGRFLVIRGACEELEVKIGAVGEVSRIVRRPVEQSRIRSFERYEFGSLEATILMENGPVSDFGDLITVLERTDVNEALLRDVPGPTVADAIELEQQQVDERELVISEPPEDDFIESVAAQPLPTGIIDVAKLWELLVVAERELVTYGQVAEDSVFDQSVKRHRVRFDLLSGSFDYNRRDRVMVEREDRNGNWRPVGLLDLQFSKPNTLFIESVRTEQSSGPPLVLEGDELRFRSRMEETSLDRRQAAVKRIIGRTSRTRDLIQAFDPRSGTRPRILAKSHPPESLKAQYGLNDKQAQALSAVLATRPLALVQGPPGTGKTGFIAALVHAALTSGLARNVLLASQAHEAVNNAAEAVLKLFDRAGEVPSILRIGNEGVVSDRLLPFHVEKVEQLQKDRFRAEMRERLTIAAQGLGISDTLSEALIHIELAIRPVAFRLASLNGNEPTGKRAHALRETISQQLSPLGIKEDVAFDTPADLILESILYACLKAVPKIDRPSADRVTKFQSVAALARDFIGTVSTERRSLETFLAGTRQIVAGTCVGLGRSALGLTSTPFDLVIVDEAARCTASELAVPIQAGAWIVLVGDHKQLEPQHPELVVDQVASKLGANVAEVARSDFERTFETAYGAEAGHTLERQYRMLPAIGEIVSQAFYAGRLEHGRTELIVGPDFLPSDLTTPVTWFDTSPCGERAIQAEPNHRKSLANTVESDIIVNLLKNWSECAQFLKWLQQQTAHTHAIGIICAYSAQRDLVRRKISMAPLHPALRAAVKVDTIDSYQGKENPIVIVSLVRNNFEGPMQDGSRTIRPGFLAKENRINVAISRAMDRLVLVGSATRWERGGPMDRISIAFANHVANGQAAKVDAAAFLDNSLEEALQRPTTIETLETVK